MPGLKGLPALSYQFSCGRKKPRCLLSQPAMLEAYCPHMGTHLGRSQASYVVESGQHVDGEGIRCPFHGWRFGADGRCDDIPYFDGPIPEKARVRSWRGAIWVVPT